MTVADTATELSLALWALKRALARHDPEEQPDIDRLRVDADFRAGVVGQAEASPHESVREAAARVRALMTVAGARAQDEAVAGRRRSATLAVAITVAIVALLGALGYSGWQWQQTRLARSEPPAAVAHRTDAATPSPARSSSVPVVPVPAPAVAGTGGASAPAVASAAAGAAVPKTADTVQTTVQSLMATADAGRATLAAAASPALVAALAAPVVPAVAAPEPAPVRLRIHGSNTIGAELGPALVERFLAQRGASDVKRIPGASHEELRIEATLPGSDGRIAVEIAAHGSGTAFTDLGAGTADLGAASRPIKPEEAQKLAALGDLGAPGAEHVIGLDGVAIIVHPGNPLRTLSREQVARLFAGEITDWAELGGKAGPVHVYARDDKSGTWDTFQTLVLGKAHKLSAQAQRFESSTDLSDKVATDPAAIGFIGLPYVRMARALAIGDGDAAPTVPTAFTVATEDYPLSRRLYFYLPPTGDNRLARELVEFALENDGQRVVEANGFVSQRVAPQRVATAPNVPKEYETLTRDALRLSVNFRFRPGSDSLDGKAQRDLRRVIDFLAQAENRSRQVLLFGFTDASGDADRNVKLSQQRAQEIARELQVRGIQTRVVRGFGPANPVAANDSPAGPERNRRVEIWVL